MRNATTLKRGLPFLWQVVNQRFTKMKNIAKLLLLSAFFLQCPLIRCPHKQIPK